MKRLLLISIALIAAAGICRAADTTRIRWATFNIRYDNSADKRNSWAFRKDSVAAYILAQRIDVVGLQEVLYNQLQDLAARLPHHEHVGVCRDDGKQKGEAVPIFYNKRRFRALDSGTFWLSQHPDSIGFIGWDGACCRIATWAKLQDKQNGSIFVAVNTHFDHVGNEARKQAALLIIRRIKQIADDKPAVLTGDFNVDSSSEAYATLTTNTFVLNDAHRTASLRQGPSYTYHDWGRLAIGHRAQIDFIFTTPSVRVLCSTIHQEHRLDPHSPDTRWGYLSDHNPVVAEIEIYNE